MDEQSEILNSTAISVGDFAGVKSKYGVRP